MSMNEAAYLNACFWGTFAFGRLMSIGIATKLAPSFMLLCNIVSVQYYFMLMDERMKLCCISATIN